MVDCDDDGDPGDDPGGEGGAAVHQGGEQRRVLHHTGSPYSCSYIALGCPTPYWEPLLLHRPRVSYTIQGALTPTVDLGCPAPYREPLLLQ